MEQEIDNTNNEAFQDGVITTIKAFMIAIAVITITKTIREAFFSK
jgi:hypothetical protein